MTTVAHWGTFEVANLGDLLFPLVLEHHLRAAHGDVEVRLVGPLGGNAPMGLDRPVARALPFEHEGFWQQAAQVDAFVLGGGELVHNGEIIIERAGAPDRISFAPFATDLGLLAEARPVAWNAVGVPVDIPDALAPLLRAATASVDLLAVRDEASRSRLEAAGVERPVDVVPDTAVLIDDVVPRQVRVRAIDRLRADRRLPSGGPVVVVHLSFATPAVLEETAAALVAVAHRRPAARFVLVALGETHGDGAALRSLAERVGASASVVANPSIEEAVAVLAAGDVVVSSSYHAVLLAAALDVPAAQFRHAAHRPTKHDALADALGRERWLLERPADLPPAVDALLDGAGPPDPTRIGRLRRGAEAHLRRVAEVVVLGHRPGVDLDERTAAHRHVVARLEARTRVASELRADVAVLREHHDRAVARATEVEAAYWRAHDQIEASVGSATTAGPGDRPMSTAGPGDRPMSTAPGDPPGLLDLAAIERSTMSDDPYRWARVGPLFTDAHAAALAASFPFDDSRERVGGDARRTWRYRVRPLLAMGSNAPAEPTGLDRWWRALAGELAGPAYRTAMSRLTGIDLDELDLEVNAFSYATGAYQDPHPDLPEKLVTHVLWFNQAWEQSDGGCLRILRSADPDDIARELTPDLRWSAVFVRSDRSWHCVSPVAEGARTDRRSVVATFHLPGSESSMWSAAAT